MGRRMASNHFSGRFTAVGASVMGSVECAFCETRLIWPFVHTTGCDLDYGARCGPGTLSINLSQTSRVKVW